MQAQAEGTEKDTGPAGPALVPPRRFDTARLHLRTLEQEDQRLYVSLYTDPELMRHVGEPLSAEAAARACGNALRQMRRAPPAAWYWVVRAERSDAGLLAMAFDHDEASAELGMLLGPALHGRGYATEAVAGLVERAFAWPHRRCLRVRHLIGHPAVPAVLRRLGFAPEEPRAGLACWRLDRDGRRPDARGQAPFAMDRG